MSYCVTWRERAGGRDHSVTKACGEVTLQYIVTDRYTCPQEERLLSHLTLKTTGTPPGDGPLSPSKACKSGPEASLL